MATEDYFARLSPPQGPGIVVQPAQGPAMPRLDTGATAVAEALVGAGKVVEDIGVKWANATDHIGANLALTDFAQKANALEHGSSQDPNYFIAPDKLKAGLEDAKRQALEMVRDPVRRSDLDRVLTGRIINSMNVASNASRSRAIEGARGAADALDQDTLARWQKNMGDRVAQESIVVERFKGIDADVKNGIYTAHAGEERKRKLGHEVDQAQLIYDTRTDAAGTAKRLEDPTNYPRLTPTQRQVAITQANNQDLQNTSDYVRGQAQRGDPVVRGAVELATRPQEDAQLVTPGNVNPLDLGGAPPATIERNGQSIVIPTVDAVTGKTLTRDEAAAQYDRSGRQLGVYATAEEAATYSQRLTTAQEALMKTPQGQAIMRLPPHMRFRALEGAKHDINALDTQARQDADRVAAWQRDTTDAVQIVKDGGRLSDPALREIYSIQGASCARSGGTGPACKFIKDLDTALTLAPIIDEGYKMEPARLGAAIMGLRGQLTAAGANPDSAQFKALHALEATLKEQTRILKEEPVALGQKTGTFKIGDVNLAAAAAGAPDALSALANRGRQAEDVRTKSGGDGSPWLVSDLPQLKQQWADADAAGKYKILAALRTTMPSVETYQGAVAAIGGDSYATVNMRNMLARDPELAKQVVRGGVILAVDNDAKVKAQEVRAQLLAYVGSDIYQPEQRRQAIDLALNLDATRRESSGKLYDPNATEGLKKAWEDVNGPIEVINGRRTPITPGITPGNFASALVRLDDRDVLRMGGAYDRAGNSLSARELQGAVLKPTEPGSSLYYVGMKRPTTEAPDGFMGFFDVEGRPLKIDMGYLTRAHPFSAIDTLNTLGVLPGGAKIPATTPARTPQRAFDFDQAVLGDLRSQFPNDSEAQLRERLDAINRQMDTPHSSDMRFLDFLAGIPTGEISGPESLNVEDRRDERRMSPVEQFGRQMIAYMRLRGHTPLYRGADPTKVDPMLNDIGYWDVGLPPREKK